MPESTKFDLRAFSICEDQMLVGAERSKEAVFILCHIYDVKNTIIVLFFSYFAMNNKLLKNEYSVVDPHGIRANTAK